MEIAKIQNNIVQPPHENQKNREGEGGAKKKQARISLILQTHILYKIEKKSVQSV